MKHEKKDFICPRCNSTQTYLTENGIMGKCLKCNFSWDRRFNENLFKYIPKNEHGKVMAFEIKEMICAFIDWLNTNQYIADPFPEENGKYLYRKFEQLEKKGINIEQLFDKFIKNYKK